jgi:hypothetical protein
MPADCVAVSKIICWKNPILQRYCCAFVKAGIDCTISGMEICFGPDDIKEESQLEEKDCHLQGCAVTILLNAEIIVPYYGHLPDQRIFGGRRMSHRKNAKNRKIQLYQLTSRGLAESFLEHNKSDFDPVQGELFK